MRLRSYGWAVLDSFLSDLEKKLLFFCKFTELRIWASLFQRSLLKVTKFRSIFVGCSCVSTTCSVGSLVSWSVRARDHELLKKFDLFGLFIDTQKSVVDQ